MPYLRALPLTASSGGAAPVEKEDVLGVGYLIDEGLAEALHTHSAEATGVVDLKPTMAEQRTGQWGEGCPHPQSDQGFGRGFLVRIALPVALEGGCDHRLHLHACKQAKGGERKTATECGQSSGPSFQTAPAS